MSDANVTTASSMDELDVDSIVDRLLAAGNLSPGTSVQLLRCEIDRLIRAARRVLMAQPMLLELSAPLKVCGDVHGQYADLLRIFGTAGLPPGTRYLFLGDYVDRGPQSVETVCLLLALKVKHPEAVFLLRGNHESASLNRRYGFKAECKNRYDSGLWRRFVDCFNCLPVAALVEERIFCCHGGLSPHLESMEQIRELRRPTAVPDAGLMCDLLWSDPEPNQNGWAPNGRGVSLTFGENQVRTFLERFDLDLVVRAHQVVQDGYEFFAQRRLITVFSAPNYCGEFDNDGAVLTVDPQLLCSLLVLRPQETASTAINKTN